MPRDFPILIKSRSSNQEPAPIKTYKLSEEELRQLNEKLGPPKSSLRKTKEIDWKGVEQKMSEILNEKVDQNVENTVDSNDEKVQKKKLGKVLLKKKLAAGQSVEEIAAEFGYEPKLVKMLIANMNKESTSSKKNTAKEKKGSLLKVGRLVGKEFDYIFDDQLQVVTICHENGEIVNINKSQLISLKEELQEVASYLV